MNSFNVYGQTEQTIGGNTPVWLGTVKPIPRGAIIYPRPADDIIPAGTMLVYDPETQEATPAPLSDDAIARANAYLYNDVYSSLDSEEPGTCAVVMHHPEGLLIERVYPDITEEQIAALQAKIPGVLLVRG